MENKEQNIKKHNNLYMIESNKSEYRVIGYDLARALAIMGMVVVNFKVVMGAAKAGADWLVWLAGLIDGRAAASFVVLAGVGLTLLARRARIDTEASQRANIRKILFKRAVFLFIVGLLYIPVWPGDILHFYGVYFAIGALLLTASNRWLWISGFTLVVIFVLLIFVFNYEAGWNWNTLEYSRFWSPAGMIRHLFFNGFHPVFPWAAFLLIGMWLGRQAVLDPAFRKKVFLFSTGLALLAECVSWLLIRYFSSKATSGEEKEIVAALLGTEPMPPMPLYMIAGAATAVSIISLSLIIAARFPRAWWLNMFVSAGQMSFTLYVAHVVIGMGILEILGRLKNQTLPFALASGAIFCVCALITAYIWRKNFKRGPLEWLMRLLTR